MNKASLTQAQHLPAEQTCAQQIGHYVSQGPLNHPQDAWESAQRAFVDTLGCMYLGANHPDTQTVLAMTRDWGAGDRPVIGTSERRPAPWAALVNGTSAHAYDFDDWEDPGITHGSAAIFPAVLAIADAATSIDAVLDAWSVGIEVIMRIGQAVNMTHYELGWHTTNTLGAIGAAAACARLTSLDQFAASNAISLSTSMAGGFTSQFGTTAKPLHAGLAAKTGVISASLAARGATAQPAIFEQDAGFLKAMTRATADQLSASLALLGTVHAISQYGLHIKRYPSCGCTHLVVEACQNIRAVHGIQFLDIAHVETVISDIARSVLPYGVPKNRTEALFSVPWCAAVALVDGSVGVESFQPETLKRQDLLELSARISVEEHPRSPGLAFHPDFPDRVKVYLKDGRFMTDSIAYPSGSPQRPLDRADLKAKFLDNARFGDLAIARAEAMFDMVFETPSGRLLSDLFVT